MRALLSALAMAVGIATSLPVFAQAARVAVEVRPGNLSDKEAIWPTPFELVFKKGEQGTIQFDLSTTDYDFDNDGGKLGIMIYEVRRKTDEPNKASPGKARTEFDCAPRGAQIHCENKHTTPGIYRYDIRVKERATGRRRSRDPIILNL